MVNRLRVHDQCRATGHPPVVCTNIHPRVLDLFCSWCCQLSLHWEVCSFTLGQTSCRSSQGLRSRSALSSCSGLPRHVRSLASTVLGHVSAALTSPCFAARTRPELLLSWPSLAKNVHSSSGLPRSICAEGVGQLNFFDAVLDEFLSFVVSISTLCTHADFRPRQVWTMLHFVLIFLSSRVVLQDLLWLSSQGATGSFRGLPSQASRLCVLRSKLSNLLCDPLDCLRVSDQKCLTSTPTLSSAIFCSGSFINVLLSKRCRQVEGCGHTVHVLVSRLLCVGDRKDQDLVVFSSAHQPGHIGFL